MADSGRSLAPSWADLSSFEARIRPYLEEAFQFCVRLSDDPTEAEDIVQEAILKAYRYQGDLRADEKFRSWFFSIMVNVRKDRIRGEARYRRKLEAARTEPARKSSEVTEEIEREELSRLIRRKIETLSDRQREVLTLHLFHHMGYAEIARVLEITYENVKMNLSLARKRLKGELRSYL